MLFQQKADDVIRLFSLIYTLHFLLCLKKREQSNTRFIIFEGITNLQLHLKMSAIERVVISVKSLGNRWS